MAVQWREASKVSAIISFSPFEQDQNFFSVLRVSLLRPSARIIHGGAYAEYNLSFILPGIALQVLLTRPGKNRATRGSFVLCLVIN